MTYLSRCLHPSGSPRSVILRERSDHATGVVCASVCHREFKSFGARLSSPKSSLRMTPPSERVDNVQPIAIRHHIYEPEPKPASNDVGPDSGTSDKYYMLLISHGLACSTVIVFPTSGSTNTSFPSVVETILRRRFRLGNPVVTFLRDTLWRTWPA